VFHWQYWRCNTPFVLLTIVFGLLVPSLATSGVSPSGAGDLARDPLADEVLDQVLRAPTSSTSARRRLPARGPRAGSVEQPVEQRCGRPVHAGLPTGSALILSRYATSSAWARCSAARPTSSAPSARARDSATRRATPSRGPRWHRVPCVRERPPRARPQATPHSRGRAAEPRTAQIEPVFANTKFNRRIDRFQRRGRSAARSAWRLITATHNLLKLHKHQTAPAGA
jgi:hypothetical protein